MIRPIYVTQPYMPPIEEFIPYLEQIWSEKILTNGGPFHRKLEEELCRHLGVRHISLFSNATIALITALKALDVTGEVITTPFSFVATANSIFWSGLKPVFVDIEPETFNIDPKKIKAAITPETAAIMPVHCYGRPCDVESIESIASVRNIKVIYDAAHAFGVKCHCGSVLNHGDISVLSFHATKVFNTFEGGAIVCSDEKLKNHIDRLKNFGFSDEVTVGVAGLNGKMSEICAAFGLLQIKHLKTALERRKEIDRIYRVELRNVKGILCLSDSDHEEVNNAYFPILVGSEYPLSRDALYYRFKENNIFVRRYFYPLISNFPMYRNIQSACRKNLPVANDVARKVLCLPIYPALSDDDLFRVIELLRW